MHQSRLQRLSDLTHVGMPRAASVLLAEEGRFLLGVRPPVVERNRVLLRLTGIGGWAVGDETFAETAARETLEETGCHLRLLDLDQTLVVQSPDDMQRSAFPGEVAPAALVYRRFGTAPFDPWSPAFESSAPVAVYAGLLLGQPCVVAHAELPLFMWLYPEQLIGLADSDAPLEYLLADGADILGTADYDPRQAIARLTDSIQALVTALGARAFPFLSDIARLTQPARVE
ncbi:MAG TPA: NUDIX domain-containing protein [Thermomicrobiales bacterium]|nr:NUDIX domain-containing protein [Thermomicrobiales bacterium]